MNTEFEWKYIEKYYYLSKKLPDNRTITIRFYRYGDPSQTKKITYYNVYLAIKHKRKQNVILQQTGKCGLVGLLWAKKQILAFGEMISEKHPNTTQKIAVGWEDLHRRNVYTRGLSKAGFTYEQIYGVKALVRTYKKNNLTS